MHTTLIIVLIIIGVILVGSILLMNPKGGGIGMGIGGASSGGSGNEYGSSKSIEGTLKKIATVSAIMFVLLLLFLPFVK